MSSLSSWLRENNGDPEKKGRLMVDPLLLLLLLPVFHFNHVRRRDETTNRSHPLNLFHHHSNPAVKCEPQTASRPILWSTTSPQHQHKKMVSLIIFNCACSPRAVREKATRVENWIWLHWKPLGGFYDDPNLMFFDGLGINSAPPQKKSCYLARSHCAISQILPRSCRLSGSL